MKVSDYGGNAREHGRAYCTATKGKFISLRCRDCETLRYCTRRELMRSSRPRCLACGGPIVDTPATEKKYRTGEIA